MPFDQTSRLGYSVTLAVQIAAVFIIGGVICLINTLFFGICCYVDAFISDLIDYFHQIDVIWINENENEMKLQIENESNHSDESDTFFLFRQFLLFNNEIFQ